MKEISIGYMARRTGLAVSTLRYYDELGLIRSNRNTGGHRRFARSEIRRVSFVMAAQSFGFTLPRIKDLLSELPQNRTPTPEDWDKLSRVFRSELNEKIAGLEKLRDTLSGCIGCGCLSFSKCELFNTNDHLKTRGTGPILLKAIPK